METTSQDGIQKICQTTKRWLWMCTYKQLYIYTHRYTITYARITDCKCILPTNHEPELWPFWDSYPAPNPNHPFSRDVGRDEIHPEKSPMASQIYPQHWSAFPSYNWSPWYSYHIPMIFSMFATADLGLPANDFQLVLINPIQPEPGPWQIGRASCRERV